MERDGTMPLQAGAVAGAAQVRRSIRRKMQASTSWMLPMLITGRVRTW